MKKQLLIGIAAFGVASRLGAQFPAAPAAGAAGAFAGPPGIAPGPAAPTPPGTLWGYLGISKEQKEFCLRKLCKTPLGSLLANGTAPLTALSGGLIGSFCPTTPTLAELADEGVVGDAAKIKLDEAKAKERRAAVRYLGTVDCHYWPEAEDGLVGALRGDRNECVRFEAALALGRGCCCTKKTIEALTIVVSCSDRDGAPKETSQRVHAAAHSALAHCLACYVEVKPEPKPPPPTPEGEARPEEPPPGAPAAAKPATPSHAKSPTELVLGEAKPIRPVALSEVKLQGRVIPGEAKPGPGQRAAAEPTPARPTGFAYYARIAQVPLPALLTEARRVATAYAPNRPLQPGNRSVAKLVTYATTAPGTPGTPAPTQLAAAEESDALADRPANLWDMLVRPSPSPVPAAKPAAPPAPAAAASTLAPMPDAPVLPIPETAPPILAPAAPAAPIAPVPAVPMTAAMPPAGPVLAPPPPEPPLARPTTIVIPVLPVEPPTVLRTRGVAQDSSAVARRVLAAKGSAAERCAALDAVEATAVRSRPELTDALVRAARDGATAEERIAGLRALARAQVYDPAVFTLMQRLTNDPSPAVRTAATTSLARLRVGLGQ